MEDPFKEHIINIMVDNIKTDDWRKVQEWFWEQERNINPTINISVENNK